MGNFELFDLLLGHRLLLFKVKGLHDGPTSLIDVRLKNFLLKSSFHVSLEISLVEVVNFYVISDVFFVQRIICPNFFDSRILLQPQHPVKHLKGLILGFRLINPLRLFLHLRHRLLGFGRICNPGQFLHKFLRFLHFFHFSPFHELNFLGDHLRTQFKDTFQFLHGIYNAYLTPDDNEKAIRDVSIVEYARVLVNFVQDDILSQRLKVLLLQIGVLFKEL